MDGADNLDTSDINHWQSILTLVVFVINNIIILFPFHFPFFVYRPIFEALHRIHGRFQTPEISRSTHDRKSTGTFVRIRIPLGLTTVPPVSVLFLLAVGAIGRQDVYAGTIGINNLSPIDIVAYAFTLGYITNAIDAAGLLRWLAFMILTKWAKTGHRLFLMVYLAIFSLGCCFGNDAVIQMGMQVLIYMTLSAANIVHPRAWIHTQFALANIGSAIFVSSNTTNVIIAQAFNVGFIEYTANIVIPVLVTVLLLFPCLLYFIFNDERFIPSQMFPHELPEEVKIRKPVNPHLPFTRDKTMDPYEYGQWFAEEREHVLNPYVDLGSSTVAVTLIFVSLAVLIGLSAANKNDVPVFWVTLPASFIMLCWDLLYGWIHRHETRRISSERRQRIAQARAEAREKLAQTSLTSAVPRFGIECGRESLSEDNSSSSVGLVNQPSTDVQDEQQDRHDAIFEEAKTSMQVPVPTIASVIAPPQPRTLDADTDVISVQQQTSQQDCPAGKNNIYRPQDTQEGENQQQTLPQDCPAENSNTGRPQDTQERENQQQTLQQDYPAENNNTDRPQHTQERENQQIETKVRSDHATDRAIDPENGLVDDKIPERLHSDDPSPFDSPSFITSAKIWAQMTWPSVSRVVSRLPFSILPFAFPMFILVQALASTGWITIFAKGWDSWVNKTGAVGAIGGMGFISVILCNFAGTNIGATVLLSRVLQHWEAMHSASGVPISERVFWGSVYALAIGVNYGPFSLTFSASLGGIGWWEDLVRMKIRVKRSDFARVNLPIIAISMAISCAVLVGEVYIMRGLSAHDIQISQR